MKYITFFVLFAVIILLTANAMPQYWAFIVLFVFSVLFAYADKKNMILLKIISFILMVLTIPVALLLSVI